MVRIALVSDAAYPWNIGGLETLERVEAEELAKKHEVHFFSMRWPGMSAEFRDNKIRYHTFHNVNKEKFYRHGRRSIREALVFSIGTLRLFRYRFDVVQANEFPVIHLPVLKLYCLLYSCKLIVDVHEVWDKEYWTTYLGNLKGRLAFIYSTLALKMGDQYIANSSLTAAKLEDLGVGKEKINVFSPVIDDGSLKRIGSSKQKPIMIFVGRLIKEKRLDRWLKVFKQVRSRRKVRGLIIGEGPEEKRIMARIREMGLSKDVTLHGFYPGSEKAKVYRKMKEASLLLHMSEREGLSMIALECIALGTPVLLPNYSPIPDDIKRMCMVSGEKNLAEVALKIIEGPKKVYIRDTEMLESFYMSKTAGFYASLFRKMELI